MSASLAAFERPRLGISNTVFKSGPLFISSKGLGWKSWKKRWFILTRTSLVFFKSDPSTLPQRGGEVNVTLGGIDINNSGSVVIREDKKLLTVLFPDGRDGRAFTLKSETLEDLYEWKTALEQALAQAPSAALVMGHNGIFHSGASESTDGSFLHWRDKRPVKSLVVGRPILLALEDIDGGPSFLEKALRFLEKYGIRVEGILRQSADVEEVDRRVEEYEQGRSEFDPNEDAHVVGDCVKHVLRQLPSSPVPASCCTALLEAYKNDRNEIRTNALRSAILETFPEPNRRLLQRILKMMQTIASHASENRMSPSAVAACMAPLLLRPLLAGECEMEDDFNSNADNSAQLLAAANAANIAQAIITALVEDYDIIFDQEISQRCSISADSRMDNSGSEDSTDDETLDTRDNEYHDADHESDPDSGDDNDIDCDRVLSGNLSESSCSAPSDLYDYKVSGAGDSNFGAAKNNIALSSRHKQNSESRACRGTNVPFNEHLGRRNKMIATETNTAIQLSGVEPQRSMGEILSSMDRGLPQPGNGLVDTSAEKPTSKPAKSSTNPKASVLWGRNNAQKALSAESFDSSGEEELAIQRLEITKNDLRHRIAKEARGNAILQASLERRKQALRERRLALEQDVSRLQEQLQAERDLRAALEVGLSMSSCQFSDSRGMDPKTRAELEEIALAEADVARLKQKVAELHHQLNQQRHHQYSSPSEGHDRYQHAPITNFQQKYIQQDFDSTLAFCNSERKQRTEDMVGVDMRNLREQIITSAINNNSNIRQTVKKQFPDSTRTVDSKTTEPSSSLSLDELGAVDSASTSRPPPPPEVMDYGRNSSVASSTLLELTTRLDFFKERRSQLMEQLHSLDINNYATTGHDGMYNNHHPPPPPPSSSPRWN